MKTRLMLAGLATLAMLSACGDEKGPGGLSPEEERGLDNAASMLDDPNNIAVPDDSMVADENEIAAEENGGGAPAEAGNGQ